MVRQRDATMQPTPQDDQLMSKHHVLGFKPQLRLEWRGQDGQNETEQPDHSANLGVSITSPPRMRFSVHTAPFPASIAAIYHGFVEVGRGPLLGFIADVELPTPDDSDCGSERPKSCLSKSQRSE